MQEIFKVGRPHDLSDPRRNKVVQGRLMALIGFVKPRILWIENRKTLALNQVSHVIDVLPLVWRPDVRRIGSPLEVEPTTLPVGGNRRVSDRQPKVKRDN